MKAAKAGAIFGIFCLFVAPFAGAEEFNRRGNLLIADQFNNRVIEVEPDGEARAPTARLSRGESAIAQSRWLRWASWRSSGYEFGTELDAPAGAKNSANVYVASILSEGVQQTVRRLSPFC